MYDILFSEDKLKLWIEVGETAFHFISFNTDDNIR